MPYNYISESELRTGFRGMYLPVMESNMTEAE